MPPLRSLSLIMLALAAGCSTHHRYTESRVIMGVRATVTCYAEDVATAREAAADAFDRMIALDGVMSDYRPGSELRRLCAAADGTAQPVSSDLFAVLVAATRMTAESDGAFDVTVGPLVAQWREARRTGRLPPAPARAAAQARVGPDRVTLDAAGPRVALVPGTEIDLGGIGKGFAADAALAALHARGVTRALVDLGGDLVAGAAPPGRRAWRVSVETGDGETVLIDLVHAAVATSGDTEQFVAIDGVRYAHLVDPATGLGLTSRNAATVIAPNGTESDALASALCVLGPERGLEMLARRRSERTHARIVTLEPARVWTSAGFPE